MDEESKHYMIISIILLIISALLLVLFLPALIGWDTSSERFVFDIVGFIWPIIGISTAFEFLRSDRDKWGWGGILFHFIILYSMIYYLIMVVQGIFEFSFELAFIGKFIIYIAITALGWFGFLYYHD